MTDSEIDRLAAGFRDLTLPKAAWTHEGHLKVGLWFLLRHPPDEAMELLRDGIQRYNVATGVPNTDTGGYHETVTRFYVTVIGAFVASADRTRPPDELATELIRDFGDRELPFRYWSREVFASTQARREWVEPDVRPLHGGHIGDFVDGGDSGG